MLDIGLYVFYVLLFIAVAAAVIFPLFNSIKEPAALIRTGIAVVAILVLFGISLCIIGFCFERNAIAFGLSEGNVKLISAGLIMFYIVLILSILALIYSEISKALK